MELIHAKRYMLIAQISSFERRNLLIEQMLVFDPSCNTDQGDQLICES